MIKTCSIRAQSHVLVLRAHTREKKWTAFATDPEWLARRAETERDGQIVASLSNQILQPTAFSAVR